MSVTVPIYTALRRTGDRRSIITGTVVSVDTANHKATVDVDGYGNVVKVPYMTPLGAAAAHSPHARAPVVGQIAVMVRSANRLWILGTFGEQVDLPDPDPDDPDQPPEEPTITTVRLTPTATGTARGGSVRPDTQDLYQGDWTGRGINSGMAVYRAKQLSGTVISCKVRIQRLDAGVFAAAAPTLRLMTQSSLVGSPTWQDSKVGPALKAGESATVILPDSWGQALIEGTAGGIGAHVSSTSPYVRLAGKAQGSMTVTLKIRSA